MNVIERIQMLKKMVKEAESIVAWQETIYTALHNLDASWVVSGTIAWARLTYVKTIASDTLRHSNDTERMVQGADGNVKVKEVKLDVDIPACRIKFDAKTDTAGRDAQVFKNGSGIGTTWDLTTSYQTYSEDFTCFVAGDLIQIYFIPGTGAPKCWVKNMRFYFDVAVPSPTNQDP